MRNIGLGTFKADAYTKAFVNDVLAKGRLSYGEYSRQFEKEFSDLHMCKYGVLSNSGTSSLQVSLQAMKELHGWEDGDKVIVPAITFVATVNIVLHNRMTPVLADVELDTYGLDPAYVYGDAKCVIPVNLFGQPCKLYKIREQAKNRNMKIIEDSCETMFATHMGDPVGSWGDIGCFSLYMAHLITAGVGGISTTNNPEYAAKMRSLVNHGRDGIYISIDDDDMVTDEIISRRFNFESVGHSYRITELESAIAYAQLLRWEKMIKSRQINAAALTSAIGELDEHLYLPRIQKGNTHSFMMYPIVMRHGDKWELCKHLEKHGIETREMLPITTQPVYKELVENARTPLPNAEIINKYGFYVGCHQDLSVDDMYFIAEVLEDYYT